MTLTRAAAGDGMALRVNEAWIQKAEKMYPGFRQDLTDAESERIPPLPCLQLKEDGSCRWRSDWTHHAPGGCAHEVQARAEQQTG